MKEQSGEQGESKTVNSMTSQELKLVWNHRHHYHDNNDGCPWNMFSNSQSNSSNSCFINQQDLREKGVELNCMNGEEDDRIIKKKKNGFD